MQSSIQGVKVAD